MLREFDNGPDGEQYFNPLNHWTAEKPIGYVLCSLGSSPDWGMVTCSPFSAEMNTNSDEKGRSEMAKRRCI